MEVFIPFLDSIESAVVSGAGAIRMVSQKPLGHAEVSLRAKDDGKWRELVVDPELNSWVTNTGLRIVMRMDIADQVIPEQYGSLSLSDSKDVYDFEVLLQQNEVAETFTLKRR